MTITLFILHSIAFSQNAIVTENALPGNPATEWDVAGAGDLSIQGYATQISVNKGNPVSFKITTAAGIGFGIKIYRLGYYNGNGARMVADLGNGFTGISQSPCITNITTGEVDCGNWTAQATWNVPATAVSGVYIAKIKRNITGGASHIIFVVRDDAANTPILFKTSDATWQAYNDYGGNNFYGGTVAGYNQGRATKVSYNRPFYNRKGVIPNTAIAGLTGLFNAEYAMIRWMERNGYNMSYTTCVDMARDPSLITPSNHKILLSVGHDEYWSAEERSKFESAANAGVSLAFFSGNEVYWKTRWENSIDGSSTPYRTLVCYKEGDGERGCGSKCDPLTNVWTGLWRYGCDFPGTDACKPENTLTGQISWAGTTTSITVQADYKNYRFWKNTGIASLGVGQSVTFPYGTLGHEWDQDLYAFSSFYPRQRIALSYTLFAGQVHKLSLYKKNSGALIFGAGTVQWSWGLDAGHDRGNLPPSRDMQQATVNLLADMGVLPGSLQSGLMAPVPSTDNTPPVVLITPPSSGTDIVVNSTTTISGTASDPGGAVGGVEISFDNGSTWQQVSGTDNWSYAWTPLTPGSVTVKVRAFDDSWNVTPPANEASLPINVIAIPTSGICASSDIPDEFNAGTTDANTIAALDGNGSLILKPSELYDFEAAAVPSGWTSAAWSGSNAPVFSGGKVILNGGHIYSNKSYAPGSTIEFSARFSDDINQNIGFSANGNFNSPWAVIGRDAISTKGNLYARSDNGGRELLGTNLTGQYHRFKIKWNSNNFEFYVDGMLLATIYESVASGIIQVSDFTANAFEISLDWMRILPYPVSGTYISKVYDAGSNTRWNMPFWNDIQSSGTDLAISFRTGNTSIPDGSWSNFTRVTNGGKIDVISRYIQYSVTLASTDNTSTPVLEDLLITCNYSFPVPPVGFKGIAVNQDVTLEWSTESEYNNKGFEVERSINGTDWITIGFVAGAGNSSSLINYKYIDKGLSEGKYYYRLKQVNTDNSFLYSNVIDLTIKAGSEYNLEQNYPNPFTGQTMISYSVPIETNVRLIIYDVTGRKIKVIDQGKKTPGRYSVEIFTGYLGHGIYYYMMQAEGYTSTKKMFVK